MEVTIVQAEKQEAVLMIDNVTVAEVLREYLVEAGADFAAWRRDHPSRPAQFRVTSEKGVAKTMNVAVSALKKDLDALKNAVKK